MRQNEKQVAFKWDIIKRGREFSTLVTGSKYPHIVYRSIQRLELYEMKVLHVFFLAVIPV